MNKININITKGNHKKVIIAIKERKNHTSEDDGSTTAKKTNRKSSEDMTIKRMVSVYENIFTWNKVNCMATGASHICSATGVHEQCPTTTTYELRHLHSCKTIYVF